MNARITQLLQLTQGERLARARKVAGLSQEEMAQRLGRDVRSIGRWERDQSSVNRTVLIAWATVTDAPLEWLERGDVVTDTVTGRYWGEMTLFDEELQVSAGIWHPSYADAA